MMALLHGLESSGNNILSSRWFHRWLKGQPQAAAGLSQKAHLFFLLS